MPAEGPTAVIGAGVMGAEIAVVDRGLERAAKVGERHVAKGRASADYPSAGLARIVPAEDGAAPAACAVAIEVVPESMETERDVFARHG